MSRYSTSSFYGVTTRPVKYPTTDTSITLDLLVDVFALVEKLSLVVDKFFPPIETSSKIISEMKAFALMNDYTFVRFAWISRHPNLEFNPYVMNPNGTVFIDAVTGLQKLNWAGYEIMNIYHEFKKDPSNDPLFKNVLF